MHEPAAVGWLLVALCGAIGTYCVARLCSRAPREAAERHADAAEGLMAAGMVVMAVPGGLGMRVPVAIWAGVFGAALLWALVAGAVAALEASPGRVRLPRAGCGRRPHRAHHLYHVVGMAAMVYMAVAAARALDGTHGTDGMAGMAGMAGMPAQAAGVPAVTGALLLFFGGYAVWQGCRLVSAGAAVRDPGGPPGALFGGGRGPEVCRMAMGLSMLSMLLAL
jgi:hypothetical protein